MVPATLSLPLALLALLASLLHRAYALPAIQVKGPFLFDSQSGSRFFLKGVAYSANYGSSESNGVKSSGTISALDPLANPAGCQRDIPFFKQLGINIIRVYQVNATLDHSQCMQALDQAGIYVVLDLATPSPNDAINTGSPSWNVGLLTNFITTVDAFGSFPNVFGFNIGNEVINNPNDNGAAPFIKAAVRDIKAYLKAHGYTQLVGYTATDSPASRSTLPFYLSCQDTAASIDYWGLNIYEWCGQNDFVGSGYRDRTNELASLGVPAFFSEFGCNNPEPRQFQDIPTLFSTNMTGVWSGGIIYEYQTEGNGFGLGQISGDGSSFSPNTDFSNLKSQYASAQPSQVSKNSFNPTTSSPPACPAQDQFPVSTNLPPTPDNTVCSCVVDTLSCTSTLTANAANASSLAAIGMGIGTVCGLSQSACSAVAANGTTGTYGALSMCDAPQILDIALDAYYEANGRTATACAFNGLASVNAQPGRPSDSAAAAAATSSCAQKGMHGGTGVPSPTSIPPGATTKPLAAGGKSGNAAPPLLAIGWRWLASVALCMAGGAALVVL